MFLGGIGVCWCPQILHENLVGISPLATKIDRGLESWTLICFFNSPSQSPSWVTKNPLSHWGSVNRCRQGWCIFLRNEELNHPRILKITGIGKVLGDNELPPSSSQLQNPQGLLGISRRKGHLWVVSAASGGTNWGWAVEVLSHCKVGHFWASKNWKKAYK